MKFCKYLSELENRSSRRLQNLNYKVLKSEIKELVQEVREGRKPCEDIRNQFRRRLCQELDLIVSEWASHVQRLAERTECFMELFDGFFDGKFMEDPEESAIRPVILLEPLRPWLELAAWADALRQHRLVQATAAIKIEKKFIKALSACGMPTNQLANSRKEGFASDHDSGPIKAVGARCGECNRNGVRQSLGVDASGMFRTSEFGGDTLHFVCQELESAGDRLLSLGLGAGKLDCHEPCCAICLSGIVDPVRLPCAHRFCIHCVLPLFNKLEVCERVDGGSNAAMLKCPLCRSEGPPAPAALSLDGLLPRMKRGMGQIPESAVPGEDTHRLTAVVVSSLAKLASDECAGSLVRASCSGSSSDSSWRGLHPVVPMITPKKMTRHLGVDNAGMSVAERIGGQAEQTAVVE